MDSMLVMLLCSAAGGALITGISNIVQDALKRRAAKKTGAATLEDVLKELKALTQKAERQGHAQRVLMYDRLNYLLERCIKVGSVPYGLRGDINGLYESYRNDLDANGDLESLVALFRQLPIKEDTHCE